MSAKLRFGFLCDGAMKVQGKWTFQGVFDRIYAQEFPALHGQAILSLKFSGPVGAHTLRMKLVNSKGETILPEIRQPIECREFQDNEVVLTVNGLPLPAAGFYTFNLYLDEQEQAFGTVEFNATYLPRPSHPNQGGG
jgi:hypothetical protein